MTQTIDRETLHLLQHQGRRMHTALHGVVPPDRKEAAAIQARVDDILDRRPRAIAVTSDGEVLFAGTSPWVAAQATAVNATPEPERVIPAPPVDLTGDDLTTNQGGVAVLDRENVRDGQPGGSAVLPPVTAAEAEQARKELGL